MNNIHLIKTEKEYDEVMSKVLALAKTNPPENSPEFEQLIILSMLIEEYDKKHLFVLSGLGVKEYYRNLGFKDDGAYLYKKITS